MGIFYPILPEFHQFLIVRFLEFSFWYYSIFQGWFYENRKSCAWNNSAIAGSKHRTWLTRPTESLIQPRSSFMYYQVYYYDFVINISYESANAKIYEWENINFSLGIILLKTSWGFVHKSPHGHPRNIFGFQFQIKETTTNKKII